MQNNYRAREPEYNRIKPHYSSDYKRHFSPANSVNRKTRSRSPPSPKTKMEWQQALMEQQRDIYAPKMSADDEIKLAKVISDNITKKHNKDQVRDLIASRVKSVAS